MPKKKSPKTPRGPRDKSPGTLSPQHLGPPDQSSGSLSPQRGHIAGERKDSDQTSESSFGSVPEQAAQTAQAAQAAHTIVDSVENLYESQHGLLPDGQLHISVEVRRAFVEMFPKLRAANYNDEACSSVLTLLFLGVDNESLKQGLPMLTSTPTDSSRISQGDMLRVQSKVEAIRQTPIPTVEEVKQALCDQVSDNGQSARQGFSSGLHAGLKSLLKNVPVSVRLENGETSHESES